MAVEDYTKYKEVDPNNHITVEKNKITHEARCNESAYVYADKGDKHFGDIEHLLELRVLSGAVHEDVGYIWMLANAINDPWALRQANETIIYAFWTITVAGDLRLVIHSWHEGAYVENSHDFTGWEGTTYYLKIIRKGTSLQIPIYSDPERTNLLYTLSVTMQGEYKFRYIYAVSATTERVDPYDGTAEISNLDLQEPAPPPEEEVALIAGLPVTTWGIIAVVVAIIISIVAVVYATRKR